MALRKACFASGRPLSFPVSEPLLELFEKNDVTALSKDIGNLEHPVKKVALAPFCKMEHSQTPKCQPKPQST